MSRDDDIAGRAIPIPVGQGLGRADSLNDQAASVGAFSLGGGSYLRSVEDVVTINYEGIELKYSKPVRRSTKKGLPSGDDAKREVQEQLAKGMLEFFKSKTCYDAMSGSSQVIIIDISLPLSVAFISALENKVPYGTLWDAQKSEYVGMMTVTDYIKVLLRTRISGESIVELQNSPISSWREKQAQEGEKVRSTLISARIDQSLLVALESLHQHKINRLPILSHTQEVLSTIGYDSMLKAVLQRLHELDDDKEWSELLSYSVGDLNIGAYGPKTPRCTLETRVYEVLSSLIDHDVHCLPIVDVSGRCLDVFTRNDVMHIEQGGTYDIELTLASAIANRPRHPVYCFNADEPLGDVMHHLGKCGVRTLIAVDTDDKVNGYLTTAHIFEWLLGKHTN
eukprot:TRINITY_DN31919_c0_g1_i1.p1 TRINITY_DN31919_c0_g1~~TRINITY_DN31919_c0_g1_i1.p1  ORF type:complete len:395 (+),score=152.44 TRINITY_DN31919_c0_g1_i1:157-1341(+)